MTTAHALRAITNYLDISQKPDILVRGADEIMYVSWERAGKHLRKSIHKYGETKKAQQQGSK